MYNVASDLGRKDQIWKKMSRANVSAFIYLPVSPREEWKR